MIQCREMKGYTDRDVTAHMPDITIKNKKRGNTHIDRCGDTRGKNCYAKGSRKEAKIHDFMYGDT
jgi:hypothetical protein